MKFEDLKVGMKVKAKNISDFKNGYTCAKDEYVGEVIDIDYKKETFTAKTLQCCQWSVTAKKFFNLDPFFFDFCKKEGNITQ